MIRTKTRATRKEINATNMLYAVAGKRRTPDYEGYERDKKELRRLILTPKEYDAQIQIIAERNGL